jgi:hypothetical protein
MWPSRLNPEPCEPRKSDLGIEEAPIPPMWGFRGRLLGCSKDPVYLPEDSIRQELGVRGLGFLQADDVGLGFAKPGARDNAICRA